MPRVTLGEGPDAMVVELDSVEDVAKLRKALQAVSQRQQPPTQSVRAPKLFSIPSISPARAIFKNGQYAAFEAMYSALKGVETSVMTKLLGVPTPKSVPPLIAAWGKRAAKLGLNMKEMLEVERGYEHGKPTTIYRLTDKGREVLRPETEPARIATDSGR